MARTRKAAKARQLATADYVRLASFRLALRRFLHFSESAAARVGLTGQQHQAMLVLRSLEGRAPVTINDLARHLLIRHNSAVGLVDRLVAQGLVARHHSPEDRRKVWLQLSRKGEQVLGNLAWMHRHKLRRIGPNIYRILAELTGAAPRRRVKPSEDS
ncbi:MAG TPA: MarR family transcriptional regulator [Burkholderiales bacterium]